MGKRRSDNGEDGVRWKLTDEPTQNKKKLASAPPLSLPSTEDTQVQAGAHKRKKEKEQPVQDTGPKKKVKDANCFKDAAFLIGKHSFILVMGQEGDAVATLPTLFCNFIVSFLECMSTSVAASGARISHGAS